MADTIIGTLIKVEAQNLVKAALDIQTNRQQQKSEAATAAAAATKSAASIPGVGWILAPVAAATVYAIATSFSAERGFGIPSGLNPKIQLHERETVLPQKYADVIRGMAGDEGGGGLHHHHHWNVHAIDAESLSDALDRHGGVLRGKIAEAAKLLASGRPAPVHKSALAQELEQLLASRADVVAKVDAAAREVLTG